MYIVQQNPTDLAARSLNTYEIISVHFVVPDS